MKLTSVFGRNLECYLNATRYIVNKGSTRSSKTYSILQLLFLIAEMSANPLIISIVSESMPHLRKGCMRDFKEILQNENKWNEANWNATNSVYTVNKSIIEFFSVDNAGKAHGPQRDILYINECINVEYEIYRQLAVRTKGTIFLDCNPCFEFWLDEKVLVQDCATLIHSTYRDNDYLSPAQIREIESNKGDAAWWKVYGEGLTGTLVGSIVENWSQITEMPGNYKKRWIGIDFGYTNDPTAIVDIRLAGGEIYIDELLYATGYDNMMIAQHLKDLGITRDVQIIADSAEPKSIAEIRSKGFTIEAAQKGKDSVTTGISVMNRYKKHVTSRSENVINEYRNYKWKLNEFGDPTNTPIDKYNHAVDAIRYVFLNKLLEKGSSFDYFIPKTK